MRSDFFETVYNVVKPTVILYTHITLIAMQEHQTEKQKQNKTM